MSVKKSWQYVLALVCLFGESACFAQEDDGKAVTNSVTVTVRNIENAANLQAEESSKYWIGVQCVELTEALRSHLNLDDGVGVMVDSVFDGSPAKKAGLQRFDVLVSAQIAGEVASDKPRKLASAKDLVDTVKTAETKTLKFNCIRNGRRVEIEIVPVERPETVVRPEVVPDIKDVNAFLKDHGLYSNPDNNARFAGPVFTYTTTAGIGGQPVIVPENVSVTIVRKGTEPAKITVKKDEQTWEVTEKQLDKLPQDLKRIVESMLGLHPAIKVAQQPQAAKNWIIKREKSGEHADAQAESVKRARDQLQLQHQLQHWQAVDATVGKAAADKQAKDLGEQLKMLKELQEKIAKIEQLLEKSQPK